MNGGEQAGRTRGRETEPVLFVFTWSYMAGGCVEFGFSIWDYEVRGRESAKV
jgi:hypothetical protein